MLRGARAQRHRAAPDGLLEHPERAAAARRGGRPRGVPRRHRRQRPQRGAGQRAGRDPLLHPLRRLPLRLPRLPADRRPRLRQRLLRAGRLGALPGPRRHPRLPRSAARQHAVRRVQGSLPGPHRHPADAAAAARARASRPANRRSGCRSASRCSAGSAPGRGCSVWPAGSAARAGRHGRDGRLDPRAARSTSRAGRASRDFPAPADESFQERWATARTIATGRSGS